MGKYFKLEESCQNWLKSAFHSLEDQPNQKTMKEYALEEKSSVKTNFRHIYDAIKFSIPLGTMMVQSTSQDRVHKSWENMWKVEEQ